MNVPKLRFKEFNDEWQNYKVEEILKISNGINKEKEFFGSGTPIINYMDVNKNELISHNIVKGLVIANSKELETFNVKKGDILFTRTSETSDEIGLSSSVIENIDKCIFSGFILKGTQTKQFIHPYFGGYYFRNPKMRKEIIKHSSITTRALTSGSLLSQMSISIPTIIEQEKIGKTLSLLDKKVELQAKKIEDLKLFKKGLLKKQYNYIKNKNLVELSDIANIYQPQTIAQNKLDNGKYFVFGANGIIGKYSKYNHKQKQITISCRGENSGKVNITPKECWITGNSMVLNIDNNSNVDKLYLKCILDSQNLRYLISGSGQPQITRRVILKHKIPLLPILDQKKFRNPFIKLDLKILLEEAKVNKLLDIKKGLMQNMFV